MSEAETGLGTAMRSGATASVLRARAAVMALRVQRLGHMPHHPFTSSQIAAIGLDVSNLRTLLTDMPDPSSDHGAELAGIAQLLNAVAARLDAIERLLGGAADREA